MGSSQEVCTAEKDDRELPVGEDGAGVLEANVCKMELLNFSVPITWMMESNAHIVSFARKVLPSPGCWSPGSIRSPTAAQIFDLTPGLASAS